MQYRHLILERDEHTALVSIHRPKALNALNAEVVMELQQALQELEANSAIGAIILTGAGEKAFVAGADIAAMVAMTPAQALNFARQGQELLRRIVSMKTPVLAAVNGFALGGGLELAMACDFVYMSSTAKVGLPEVTLGIMPGFGGTQRLPQLVGRNRANELIMTGRMISAREACEWGIANALCEPAELLERTRECARRIAANSRNAVASAKEAIARGLDMGHDDGLAYESALFAGLFAGADQREGMQAFLQKRTPQFIPGGE
ncbi:enoyl-CoA hydratase/isomerase family protein [Desulfurispirillum indicum]|uniref:enoyl-CoA hydratase/isomerase family protein n=1 Tax=Desulfurispirillum indicum TaxID=936456 RepID=UPI001CFB1879|nr:enoyl-CoA hydratase-related protein [Desulfurispirillum indicum]UCZ55537.1 enoyl-CoA hydratase/isomerase family protein [Desulfurispirillum indicum]